MQKGIEAGVDGPLPEDKNRYLDLSIVKETLEWAHPKLIKTITKPKDPNHLSEIMGHKFYALGPVDAILTWPRQ